MTVSSILHCNTWKSTKALNFWRKADHVVIFLCIAGIYTSFFALIADPSSSSALLVTRIVWGCALIGKDVLNGEELMRLDADSSEIGASQGPSGN